MNVKISQLETLAAEYGMSDRPAGERAYIESPIRIHDGVVSGLPHSHITPLVSDPHTRYYCYRVVVRGFTIEHFVAIVKAYASGRFEEAERLIKEVAPQSGRRMSLG